MESHELLGREATLASISRALRFADDHGQALVLVGERGIGKTACLRAARQVARSMGRAVLETTGYEAETHLAFAGLHRLLRPVLSSVNALPDAQRTALLAVLGMGSGDHRTRNDSLAVHLATLNLLRDGAGSTGLLITADDVQWLDPPTRDVLTFVARRLESQRIVMVATSSATSDEFTAGDTFRWAQLDRLDESQAHRLLAFHAPDLPRSRRVWVAGHAVGNPLALLELARTAADNDVESVDPIGPAWSLTRRLERAFAAGVRDLTGAPRDAALVAAVALDPRSPEVLAATALLSGRSSNIADFETLQATGLLRVDETRVHFTHPLVKVAIVHAESASRRQAAHRALGAVITLSSHRRAWHRALGATAHDEAVAADLEVAASDSARRGDIPAAIKAQERAAELSVEPTERGRRLLAAAGHAARLGKADEVLRLVGAAIEGALTDFDRMRAELLSEEFDGTVIADSNRVNHLCAMADCAAAAGEATLALELADAAARRRCAAPIDAPTLGRLTSLAQGLVMTSDEPRAVAVLALADPIGHGRVVLSMLAEVDDATPSDGEELTAYGVAARAVGDYRSASDYFDRAEVVLRAGGLLGPLARNLCVAADIRLDLGEWDRTSAALVGFSALAGESMSESHRASVLATTAKLTALRGDTPAALDLLSQAEHSPAARRGSRFLARAQIARGITCLAAGRHEEAYVALRRVFDRRDPTHHFREQLDAVCYLAEAAAHTGHHDPARIVTRRMRRIADTSGSPALLDQLAYAEAVLATDDHAETLFLTALTSDRIGSPWLRARAQLAYGRWLRRQYRASQSRTPLQASLKALQQLGALRWATEARDELKAAELHRSAGPDVSAADRLTTQEFKIARFAAQGLSNKEIGEQLYLSARTVSSHLYRIFPKLGISTRAQIAGRLSGVVGARGASDGAHAV